MPVTRMGRVLIGSDRMLVVRFDQTKTWVEVGKQGWPEA